MAIDAGEAFERNGVEPFFDKNPVHIVDDFCDLFCVSAGHIKFRKTDDLKAVFSGSRIYGERNYCLRLLICLEV